MKIKYVFNRYWYKLFASRHVSDICGHETRSAGTIHVFGKAEQMKMPLNKDTGSPDFCLDCIGEMSIRCAWCNSTITIGDPITLYTPTEKDFEVPSHAVRFQEKPLQLVGCLRRGCADSGIDRSGFWYPTDKEGYEKNGSVGEVYRVTSPLEMMLQGDGKGNPQGVVVSDLRDPSNLGETFNVN
jgi:hypothetical protein